MKTLIPAFEVCRGLKAKTRRTNIFSSHRDEWGGDRVINAYHKLWRVVGKSWHL